MSFAAEEIASQPGCWRKASELADGVATFLPSGSESAAVAGCGTSWFVSKAYAALRREARLGRTEAFSASEFLDGNYERMVVISRSGTTTEVLRLVGSLGGKLSVTAITGPKGTPLEEIAGRTITLEFADERSVVQTRFATSTLALLRTNLGEDLSRPIAQAEQALAAELPQIDDVDHLVFLGHGWSNAIADEAALKLQETAQMHVESHPAMEYRHGPISLAGRNSLVWVLGTPDPTIAEDVRSTGANVIVSERDPMAELVLIQRTAVAIAEARGLDPDNPRGLTRSVLLS